jgi:hypothetical protein
MKIKGNWNLIEIFISGLVTVIFINYLATGFTDVVFNINSLLNWLQKSDLLNHLIRQIFK